MRTHGPCGHVVRSPTLDDARFAVDHNVHDGTRSLSVSVSMGATIKNSAIRALCVPCRSVPLCQRSALVHLAKIPSADRESGDARGWIRYFHQCLGERNGARDWRKRREQNATIVVRSGVRLKRSAPFLARRRSYPHSRRRRNRAAPWQPT